MIAIVLLAIFSSNVVLSHNYIPSDDTDEEQLVVKKLANLIRHQGDAKENYLLGDEGKKKVHTENEISDSKQPQPAFTYETPKPITPNDASRLNDKQPFAVPSYDYRFFQSDFSAPRQNNAYASKFENTKYSPPSDNEKKIKITSSEFVPRVHQHDNQKKSDKIKLEPIDGLDEETGRKILTHYKSNPSLIPVGGIMKSLRFPDNIEYLVGRSPNKMLAITYGTMLAVLVVSSAIVFLMYNKLKKKVKDAEDVDYPAYGVTGPCKEAPIPTGDRHLAHSAQMFHYQSKKQQLNNMEKGQSQKICRKGTESGSEDDDMAVYECPGLAPVTGEMEVKNPMFQEENEVNSPSVTTCDEIKKPQSEVNKEENKK